MKIRIMKQKALELLKSNLSVTYDMYYQNPTNKWIYDLFKGDPFVDFKEIPDFELSSFDFKSIGQTDFNNCKILQENLNLTPSQACDERLWAGLCHDVFYDYVRRRWKMNDKSKKVVKDKAIGEIQSRFFYKGGKRAGIYRNTLAKCWWVGKLTKSNDNGYELLEKLGYSDFATKVSDIFRNYTFISNHEILKGVIEGISYFDNEGIKLGVAKNIRPVLQYINAVGGGTLLDYWTYEDIRDLFIEQENNLLNGKTSFEEIDDSIDVDDDLDEAINSELTDMPSQEKKTVGLTSIVTVKDIVSNEEKKFYMFYNGNVTKVANYIFNKRINDTFVFEDCEYEIIEINN